MDFKHLRSFITIADVGSFTRAAKQIHIAQPALSNQISALENELGSKLFVRSPQGVTLTDTGTQLYAHAQKILKFNDEAKADIQSIEQVPSGRVSLGCQNSLAGALGSALLPKATEKFPNINLTLLANNSGELYHATSMAKLDFSIVYKAMVIEDDNDEVLHREDLFSSTTLDYQTLFEEELYFCSPRTPAEANTSTISSLPIETLSNQRILLPPIHHAMTDNIHWIAQSNNIELKNISHSDSIQVVLKLTAEGFGSAFIPAIALHCLGYNDLISKHRIEGYKIKRQVVLCCSPQADMYAAPRAIKDMISEVTQGLAFIKEAHSL